METAMAKVLSDILMAFDRVDEAALALLDLSAAFDTVDHCILLRRLRESSASAAWRSLVPDRSSAVCLSYRNAVSAGVHQVWGAAGLRPLAAAFCVVHRRSRPADRRCTAISNLSVVS